MPKLGFVTAALAFCVDWAVKLYILYGLDFINLREGQGFEVTSFFNVIIVWNPGVSFGLFPAESEQARYFLIGFALVVITVLVFWLLQATNRWISVALGLIIGGAFANVVDRVVYGKVADFFNFHIGDWHWYVFNIADAAIVIGVVLLIADSLFSQEPTKQAGERVS